MELIAKISANAMVPKVDPPEEKTVWWSVCSRIQTALGGRLPAEIVCDYYNYISQPGNVDAAIGFLNMIHRVRNELAMRYNCFILFTDNIFTGVERCCSFILEAIHSIDFYVEMCDEYASAVRLLDLD